MRHLHIILSNSLLLWLCCLLLSFFWPYCYPLPLQGPLWLHWAHPHNPGVFRELGCRYMWRTIWFFQWSCMDVRVGLWRRLSAEELMLLNCSVGEDSWESLGLQEIQPVHSEGDQPWDFFGRNDANAETPVLWLPHAKSWLIGKVSDAGRDWGQEEKGTTEDETAGWHHWLDGR